jgi:diphthamide synthase subunit DPH2
MPLFYSRCLTRQFFQFQRPEEACEQHEANTNGNNNNNERILEEKSHKNDSSLEQPAKKVCTKMPDDLKNFIIHLASIIRDSRWWSNAEVLIRISQQY